MPLIKIDRPRSRHVYWSHVLDTNLTKLQFENHAIYPKKNGTDAYVDKESNDIIYGLLSRIALDFTDMTACYLVGFI